MAGDLNFDASKHEPQQAFDVIPTSWQPVRISAAEIKDTKDKSGSYLSLELDIVSGTYRGQKGFARLNINNQNPVAVEIAQRQLSAICHAVGVLQVEDSKQLIGTKPFEAKFKAVPAVVDEHTGEERYAAKNDITGFRPIKDEAVLSENASTASTGEDVPAWVTEGTPEEKPAAEEAPAPPAPPEPPAPPKEERETGPVMTEKANGLSYDEWIKQGWTDEQLIEHGYMESAPSGPPSPPTPPGSAEPASKPPWQK